MYLDPRLWAFTRGVRLRIAWTVLVGLVAVGVGISRLVLFGWLLARVIAGAPLQALAVPAALTAAAIVLRGVLDFYRNMVAHHTAARVQARLRQALYDHIAALGPAHFTRSRTGDVILSMVEGIQQLEVYFGQYIPQLFVAALTPILIFAFVAFVDLPISIVFLVAALVTLVAPGAWHRMDRARSMERSRAYAAFGAEFLDAVQGLGTLKAYGQSATRGKLLQAKGKALFESTMGVLGTNTLARGITDTGIAVGAAVAVDCVVGTALGAIVGTSVGLVVGTAVDATVGATVAVRPALPLPSPPHPAAPTSSAAPTRHSRRCVRQRPPRWVTESATRAGITRLIWR